MKLDIATLSFILCTTSIIQVIGIYFHGKLNKGFDGTKYWVLGNLFIAIGVFSICIRSFIINNFMLIILSNMSLVLAQILIYIGIVRFLKTKVKTGIIFSIFLISTICFLYLTYINDNITWRTIISSIVMATNSFLIAFELLKYKINSLRSSVVFLGGIFLFYGIFYIIRLISIVYINNLHNIFDPSIMQISVFVISISASYLYSFGLIIMINQRVSVEEKEAQTRFQLIFETSPDAIDITNLENGLIVEVNDKFLSAVGFCKGDLIGKEIISLGLWKNPKVRDEFIQILKRDGYCENFELELRKKDGTTFIGLTSAKIMDLNGEKHVINVTRDITERKIIEQTVRNNEEKFKTIANYTANLEIWIGVNGELIWMNPAVKKFTGYSTEEFMTMPDFLNALVLKDDLPKVQEMYNYALNGSEENESNVELRCVRKDSSIFWIDANWSKVYDSADKFLGIRVSGRDITNFKLANDKINILSQAIEQSPASTIITDLNGNIEYVNKKFTEVTGYSYKEAMGENPKILKTDYYSEEEYKNLWGIILTGKEWRGEFHNKKKNGELYWESAIISPIIDHEGNIKKIIAIKEDISERKRLENELKRQARTDGLTGLSNRRHFMESAETELIRNKRYHTENAFLMLDIDYFKKVNDNFGHAVGDVAIKMVADVCIETIRKTDIVGRIGGEEFAILLVETNYTDAIEIAERLRLNVENIELFDDKGVQVNLRISVGITNFHLDEDSLEGLMIRSDKALYIAKNEGRNRVFSIA